MSSLGQVILQVSVYSLNMRRNQEKREVYGKFDTSESITTPAQQKNLSSC